MTNEHDICFGYNGYKVFSWPAKTLKSTFDGIFVTSRQSCWKVSSWSKVSDKPVCHRSIYMGTPYANLSLFQSPAATLQATALSGNCLATHAG